MDPPAPEEASFGDEAPATVDASAPQFCRDLVALSSLQEMDELLANLADGVPGAAGDLSAAADDLRLVDAPASVESLLSVVADAAELLAQQGLAGSGPSELAAALSSLGEEVQPLCGYPVG